MDEAAKDRIDQMFERSQRLGISLGVVIIIAGLTIGVTMAKAQSRAAHRRWGHSIQGRIISQGPATGESTNPYRENVVSFTDRTGKDRVVTRLLPWNLPVGTELKMWADPAGKAFVAEDLTVGGLDPWPITQGTVLWWTILGLIVGAVVGIGTMLIGISGYDRLLKASNLESIPDREQT